MYVLRYHKYIMVGGNMLPDGEELMTGNVTVLIII